MNLWHKGHTNRLCLECLTAYRFFVRVAVLVLFPNNMCVRMRTLACIHACIHTWKTQPYVRTIKAKVDHRLFRDIVSWLRATVDSVRPTSKNGWSGSRALGKRRRSLTYEPTVSLQAQVRLVSCKVVQGVGMCLCVCETNEASRSSSTWHTHLSFVVKLYVQRQAKREVALESFLYDE